MSVKMRQYYANFEWNSNLPLIWDSSLENFLMRKVSVQQTFRFLWDSSGYMRPNKTAHSKYVNIFLKSWLIYIIIKNYNQKVFNRQKYFQFFIAELSFLWKKLKFLNEYLLKKSIKKK